MAYLLGLKRTGHPIIIVHTGREDPPDYSHFEVRDGRGMFLEERAPSGPTDFSRPPSTGNKWDDLPVDVATSERGASR